MYQVDFADYRDEVVTHLSDACVTAREHIQTVQKKQKSHYDRKSVKSNLKVGDQVMVYFPQAVQGKAWKFSCPYYGPYKVFSLTPSNAEVCLTDSLDDQSIFVALDRVRLCYLEMTNDVRMGHGSHGSLCKKMKKRLSQLQENATTRTLPSPEYTGPKTRSRGHAKVNTT